MNGDNNLVTIHYDDENHTAVVKCDCGNYFKFQTIPEGYCPKCGGKINRYVAQNIPMKYVPTGFKAFLFGYYNIEPYRSCYYNERDHWGVRKEYLLVVYNPDRINHIDKRVFEGWCYEHGYEPVFYKEHTEGSGKLSYMGYENHRGTFKHMTINQFQSLLMEDIERIRSTGCHVAKYLWEQ